MAEPFHLTRFVQAQDPVMTEVRRELGSGRKTSHWMWFVFPQLAGLGHSATARHYAIGSLAEAAAYLEHPVLGPRLVDCTELVNKLDGRSAEAIFGSPDDLKFRSSMTLFAHARRGFTQARPGASVFRDALRQYFAGESDPATLAKL